VQEYAVNTDGSLNLLGTPLTYVPNSLARLAVTPDGKFLYTLTNSPSATTPAPLTLTAYSIDPTTGALAAGASVNVGAADLGLTVDPLGRFIYLSNYTGSTFQASAVLTSYAINSSTGALTAVGTGTTVQSNVGQLLADPSGVSLYMANNLNFTAAQDSLQALSIDQSGTITLNGSSMQTNPAGSVPWQLLSESTGRYIYLESQSGSTTNSTLLSTFSVSTASGTSGQLVSVGSPITLPSTSTGSMAYVQGSASGG
jgi:6-phosphogluconolactonase (cycloisomerase 2 family)